MNVQDIDPSRFEQSAFSRKAEILSRVDSRERKFAAELRVAGVVLARDGILNPEGFETLVLVNVTAANCLLRRPGFVGIDHQIHVRPHHFVGNRHSLQVPLDIGMSHLNFDSLKSHRLEVTQSATKFLVAQMEVERAAVGRDGRVRSSE